MSYAERQRRQAEWLAAAQEERLQPTRELLAKIRSAGQGQHPPVKVSRTAVVADAVGEAIETVGGWLLVAVVLIVVMLIGPIIFTLICIGGLLLLAAGLIYGIIEEGIEKLKRRWARPPKTGGTHRVN